MQEQERVVEMKEVEIDKTRYLKIRLASGQEILATLVFEEVIHWNDSLYGMSSRTVSKVGNRPPDCALAWSRELRQCTCGKHIYSRIDDVSTREAVYAHTVFLLPNYPLLFEEKIVKAYITRDTKYVIAIDVGGSNVRMAIVGSDKTITPDEPYTYAVEHIRTYEDFVSIMTNAIKEMREREPETCGVGIAMPGPFDYEEGIALATHKLPALYNRNLKTTLSANLGLPIYFLNDAEAFAVGAWWMAPGLPTKFLALTLGTGLGACFFADGAAVRSGNDVPTYGEIWDAPYRGGILEDFVSRNAIEQLYNQKLRDDPSLPALGSVKEIAEAARIDNEPARVVFHEFGANLGAGIAPHVKAFRPELIVIGGQIAKAFDLFGSSAQGVLNEQTGLKVPLTTFFLGDRDENALMGAAYYCLRKLDILSPRKKIDQLTN